MSDQDNPESNKSPGEASDGGGMGGCLKVVFYLVLIGVGLVVLVFGVCLISMRR